MKFKIVVRIIVLIIIVLAALAALNLSISKANSSELPESQILPYAYEGDPQACEAESIVYKCSAHFILAGDLEYLCEGFVATPIGFKPKWVARCENKSCAIVHSA
ncbi:MAG: hypothetical protein CFH43_00226 [Proteobacteria bacterium]|nr:MAG: hypothetical protein CFH43_00226 [Pseudomonadota bacterium]